MSMIYPVVGIPVDVKLMEGNPFHVVGEKYINAVAHGAGCYPVLLPAMGEGAQLKSLTEKYDIEKIADGLSGIFLPGSASNIHPQHYGQELATPDQPVDHQRDATTLKLIRYALTAGIPLLAACRGFQEMNVAFGGTIHQKVHEVDGYMDHREDSSLPRMDQYRHAHTITLTEGGVLHKLYGQSAAQVNSLHGQGIDRLGEGLSVEALAPDSLVEAFSVEGASNFALGVQWHPEWDFRNDRLSTEIFSAFGAAAKQRHDQLSR